MVRIKNAPIHLPAYRGQENSWRVLVKDAKKILNKLSQVELYRKLFFNKKI